MAVVWKPAMKLLTTSEAIEYTAARGLKRAPSTWAHWAQEGEPPYRKDASRYRLYDPKDLDEFMRSRLGPRQQSTKSPRPAA